MKAMVLAAGLGTRLRPLTDDRPKALVELGNRTLLEIALTRLLEFGVRDVIVNVHHFADMVINYLQANENFGMHIEISREETLLDTGGGLKKAGWFFAGESEPFILHNVDVISTIDLREMVRFHNEKQGLATLAVKERPSSRYLIFDEHLQLSGRRFVREQKVETVRPAQRPQDLAFAGIHVISPRLPSLITEEGIFSIITSYLGLAGQGEKILGFRADSYKWRDLGTVESLKEAAAEFCKLLREQGYEAYYHHTDAASMVTVGSFGREAIIEPPRDKRAAASGIVAIPTYHPEIIAMQQQELLKYNLLNGGIQYVRKPDGSRVPIMSRLVEIPHSQGSAP
jgi:NDP-sugar pyrophosphorylase family protein